jgi:hypothetical protein
MTIRMDNRTGKYSAKGLRTDAQQTTANILAGGVDKLLSYVFFFFFFFLPQKNKENRFET